MIPNETLQHVEAIGQTKQVGNFKITDTTQARILVSLSDKMYTRKQLAAVREYSTNAADAHKVVGRSFTEILVTLPTMEDLNLRIRDFGTGLTEQQIADVYCIFGESTKRNSNEFNGLLGYGCKAGFASADSFTVTSWINGEKSVYQCIKGDSTKLHSAILLSRCASDEPVGIEIIIPVKQDDLWTFHREAVDFYKYWPTLPTLNNLTDDEKSKLDAFRSVPATLKGEGWEIRPASQGARGIAYMGYVPYQIDWNVLYHKMSLTSKTRVLFDLLQKNDVTLYFNMGEVNFVDSRESLEYTDLTIKALIARLQSIFDKIKDSIQQKFDTAANLWDAKILYNAIFGTGTLFVEKGENSDVSEKIKILDGNLMHLETVFHGDFKWQGVDLNSPDFERINRFDNSTTGIINGKEYTPIEPVMITYRKKKNRAKVNRCKGDSNNYILASSQVAVVLNDTGMKTGQSMVSRYLIFGSNKGIRTVHVLNFTSKATKASFDKEYSFESVPVIKLSEILPEAKTWHNANKVSRSYSSGGNGGGTRVLRYMDIESGAIDETEVPICELEEGGYFVTLGEVQRRRWHNHRLMVMMGDNWLKVDASDVVKYLKVLVKELDLDLDRVYIITKQTRETKWFGEALASGDWLPLWPYVKENLEYLNVQELVSAESFEGVTDVCGKAAEYLKKNIMDKNSPMLKLVELVADKGQEHNIEIVDALKNLFLWDTVKGKTEPTVSFEQVNQRAHDSYPYLSWNEVENDYYSNPENLKKVVNYVNAMDLYVDLGGMTETPAEAPAEAVTA